MSKERYSSICLFSVSILALSMTASCGGEAESDPTTVSSTSSSTATSSTTTTTPTTTTTTVTTTPTTSTTSTTTTPTKSKAWNFLVFMNGDNDLEFYVTADLNELERSGSGENINVLVQADRSEGYYAGDGDWTNTRRYYVTFDEDPNVVSSEVVADMGELDMGDPEVLSDFIFWAAENYPAENTALIIWNHGDGWSIKDPMQTNGPASAISWDDESGNYLSIAEGDLDLALSAYVKEYGKLGVIGFDACNMATFEVGHSLKNYAEYMSASQATVGMLGYQYNLTLDMVHENSKVDAFAVADQLVYDAAEVNGEWTQSVTDLSKMDNVGASLDALAGWALEDLEVRSSVIHAAIDEARGLDNWYKEYYLDLKDFGNVLSESTDPVVAKYGESIVANLNDAVVANYTNNPYAWAGGLDVNTDLTMKWLLGYMEGSWAQESRWDDLLMAMALM
jgi:hypothetical protein